jgi:hypothetical protein
MADDEDVLRNPLSVEDAEYEIVHEPSLTAVHVASSLDEARGRARLLVEHGFGATVAKVGDPPAYEVRVLPDDVARAAEVLHEGDGGRVAPAPGAAPDPAPAPATIEDPPIPWKTLIAIWFVAMTVIPLLAFVGAYFLTR